MNKNKSEKVRSSKEGKKKKTQAREQGRKGGVREHKKKKITMINFFRLELNMSFYSFGHLACRVLPLSSEECF